MIAHNYLLFSFIIVWFYNIFIISNWTSVKKESWKFLKNFSFHPNFQFSGSTKLHISCHNLAELWPRTKLSSPKYPPRIPLKCPADMTYGNLSRLGDIGKDIKGSKWHPLGVYVDQKNLVFPELNKEINAQSSSLRSEIVAEKIHLFLNIFHSHEMISWVRPCGINAHSVSPPPPPQPDIYSSGTN